VTTVPLSGVHQDQRPRPGCTNLLAIRRRLDRFALMGTVGGMYFFATGMITHPDQIGPHMEEETRVLNELRDSGLVREAFRKMTGGVVSFLEAESLEEAEAGMARLPFVALGLMTFDYAEVVEL
jgi:hypothetical protein